MPETIFSLKIKSTAFRNGGDIPKKYSCHGDNINPPIEINDYPRETESLAIIVEDPDAPNGTFDHWVTWNIPVNDLIPENYPAKEQGNNGRNKIGYTGPCPPSGRHRYFFKIYALDCLVDLPQGSTKHDLLKEMKDHILAGGELMGYFSAEK
ncbi:MAG: YbhB/YbcL family Raf kinase inhibitor-like protein [Bacteroidetes bacterium]|nr:MAG: YbhB/YbcL family Raf kinase inhibitor-like protein [Bacteroidota bacterium]